MGKPEAYVEHYLTEQAEKLGFYCKKFVSPGSNGHPDRIVIGYGHTAFVETKARTGTARKLQTIVIKRMRSYGAEVYIARTREAVDRVLEYMKNNPIKPFKTELTEGKDEK